MGQHVSALFLTYEQMCCCMVENDRRGLTVFRSGPLTLTMVVTMGPHEPPKSAETGTGAPPRRGPADLLDSAV
jgi:hypothetical protein